MNAGAIIIGRQNRTMRDFRNAGATSPGNARTLDELGCRRSLVFHGLVRRGVLVETPDGRYYMDTERAEAFRFRRRWVLIAVLGITMVAAAVLLWLR